jgi:hypothetical protein
MKALVDKEFLWALDPAEMPMKPMAADRVVAEGLRALRANRPTHIAERMNRLLSRLMPRSVRSA